MPGLAIVLLPLLGWLGGASAQSDIREPIERDQLEVVQQHVGKGPGQFPVNGRDGVVPLLVAVRANAVQTARWLLSQGASVDVRSPGGSTALSLASYYGHVPMVRVLVDAGAVLGAKSPNGYQPLDWALENKHEPVFAALVLAWGLRDVSSDAERTVLQQIDKGLPFAVTDVAGFTSYPLVLAIAKNQTAFVAQLIGQGLDPNRQNTAGYAPLPTAARLGRHEAIQLLLRAGADPNIGGTPGNDVAGALNQAARGLQTEAAKLLIDAGAQVNRGNAIGVTPLHISATVDTDAGELTRLLLQHAADVRRKAHDGYNPLDVAMENKNRLFLQLAMSQLLLQSIPDPVQRATVQKAMDGATQPLPLPLPHIAAESAVLLLNYAIVKGDVALFDKALAATVDLEARNRSGHYPLSLAARWGETAMVKKLLQRSARVDQANENRYQTTALMESTRDGHLDVAQALLAAGARINAPDVHNDHALNWAVFFGHSALVAQLLERGADPRQIGQQTQDNAMDIAVRRKFPEVVALLERAGAQASK